MKALNCHIRTHYEFSPMPCRRYNMKASYERASYIKRLLFAWKLGKYEGT